MNRVLIAEDEERIASFVAKGLRANGFTPTVVSDGRTALDHGLTGEFDLMLLDLGLPELDGFTVLGRLRTAGSAMPVVILTARSSVQDTVAGLEGGADDYLSKPFRFEELLARIRLRLRDDRGAEPAILRRGSLALDLRSRCAVVDGRMVPLTAREFVLVEVFLRNAGQVLSREMLLSRVWGFEFDPTSNVVDVYVRYLRRKLGVDRFETVRGAGYRLV
ncbi:response regulator [Kribbella italica]|uniref:DNA-binding response OmpR family regulator n=1 Tax=Kribbella italica TaxID=1540520 RepID=A0A7W9MTX7_9ACTN|nr:DNA-binding response OmpR family regulator [Kribbella italica]